MDSDPSLVPDQPPTPVPSSPAGKSFWLGMDHWASLSLFNPRIGPWAMYMGWMMLVSAVASYLPIAYAPAKIMQLVAVCYLAWRWRKLMPELTLHFHWSVIPVSVFLFLMWIMLGWHHTGEFGVRFEALLALQPADLPTDPQSFWVEHRHNPAIFWPASIAHLLAMMTAVPIIEEVFNRSLILRTLHRPRKTALGIMQMMTDLPLIGHWLVHSKWGERICSSPAVFGPELKRHALGQLSVFGVIISTLFFVSVHNRPDWAGAAVCGIVWCFMLAWTKHKGLGPIIYSHALTNLLLWAYVIYFQDWRFM